MLVFLGYFCWHSNASAEVNQYGIDCAITPWYSSCQGGEFVNPNDPDVTSHQIGDDGYVSVPLPFAFSLYGRTFVHSWMHSNGVVSFLSVPNGTTEDASPYNYGGLCCSGEDIAGLTSGSNTGGGYYSLQGNSAHHGGIPFISYSIAALWTDLIGMNVDKDGDGVFDNGFFTRRIDTSGDGQFDTLRYYWRNISEFADTNYTNTFGVEINDQNAIELHYFDINIRNHTVTIAVTGDLTNGEVQQFTYYQANANNVMNLSSLPGSDIESTTDATVLHFDLAGACAVQPLISPSCDGYAEAYAKLIYDTSCSADPLYDTGCPGYQEAYYNQQCTIDPLYDTGCSGYAEAYYDQQCTLDPLYDSGCQGYAEAYYDQQCTLDPLYDTGCNGYAEAYYNQQCTIDALYDTGCPGYATAYYNQQCTIDPLYDTGCPGYATAYYNQQCGLDSLYDAGCPGYEEAYFNTYIAPELERQAQAAAGVSTDTTSTAPTTVVTVPDPVASLTQPSSTGDATVDSVIAPPSTTSAAGATIQESINVDTTATVDSAGAVSVETTTTVDSTVEPAQEATVEQEVVASLEAEVEAELDSANGESDEAQSSDNVEESVGSDREDKNSSSTESSSQGNSRDGVQGGNQSGKSAPLTKEQREKAKREKIKEIIVEKAKSLAEDMSKAATVEQQQAIQAQLNALLAYVPGFNAYGQVAIPGVDFYQDQAFYEDKKIPEGRRGLRNGLAQQLLHNQMVDQQYERLRK